MWGKIIIPMYRLWLNGLCGLYGPRRPLSSKRPINLISLSLSLVFIDLETIVHRNRDLIYYQIIVNRFVDHFDDLVIFKRVYQIKCNMGWIYNDVIMNVMASQITSVTIVYSTIYSRHRWKKTSKLRVTGLCEGNSLVTSEFSAQKVSDTENVSISWRHHELAIASHGQTGKITQVVLESKRGLRLGAFQGHTYITGSNPGDSVHSAIDLRVSNWFSCDINHYYTPRFNEVERGVHWFHLVRLWTESCPLCIFNNTLRIHFIFALHIEQFQKVCRM